MMRTGGNSGYGFASPQSGIALVMVLWILLLVTISTGAYTLMARMDVLEAHTMLWGTRARMAAEAGLNLAVLALRDPDEFTRWIPDGRPYELRFQDAILEIKVTDERGKLDINAVDEVALQQLFLNNELDDDEATYLAAAVKDWNDPDEMERPNGAEVETYLASGLSVGPGNHSFVMVDELMQVMGISWELYQKIEPGLTVFSQANEPNPAYAPVEALMALPDMTRATIRLGGSPDGRPFRILRWREGFHH